jgi:uncharacterized protein YgiM (DUF1202 family)
MTNRRKTLVLFALLVTTLACSLTNPPPQDASIHAPPATPATPVTPIRAQFAISITPVDTAETCLVSVKALNLRECASIKCSVTDWLQANEKLVILATASEWLKVETQDGKTGWVNGKYCGGQP